MNVTKFSEPVLSTTRQLFVEYVHSAVLPSTPSVLCCVDRSALLVDFLRDGLTGSLHVAVTPTSTHPLLLPPANITDFNQHYLSDE